MTFCVSWKVKGILKKGNEEKLNKGFVTIIQKAVKENEDVLFFWASACATVDQELMNLLHSPELHS